MPAIDTETILNETRWSILQELAREPQCVTELARACGLSAATVSQQVRLLAAFGIVTPEQETRETPGKPKTRYSIAKELGVVAILGKSGAGLRTFTPNAQQQAVMRAWLWKHEDASYLEKFLWTDEELVAASSALAVIETAGEEIHLLVVAPEEALERLRKHHSKRVVERPDGGKRTFICWTHSTQELKDGLEREEHYYRNLFKKHYVVFDRAQALRELGV